MIYKLSYNVAFDPKATQEVFAENEIELAHALLDMERDVGKVCFNVVIEEVDRPEGFQRMDLATCLRAIQTWAKILEKDLKNK
jgi:hypothetical protein